MSAPSTSPTKRATKPPWALIGIIAIVAVLCVPLGAALTVVATAQQDDRVPSQAIVVMDASQSWGATGTDEDARLQHAIDLHTAGVAPVIMTLGPKNQAEKAREWLIDHGVDARDVLAVPTSQDTIGSLTVVGAVMRDLGWSSATIVTDPAHEARAKAVADLVGIDAHGSGAKSASGPGLTGEYVARETAALLRLHLLSRWSIPQLIQR